MDCCSGNKDAKSETGQAFGNASSGKNWVAVIAIILIIIMVAGIVLR